MFDKKYATIKIAEVRARSDSHYDFLISTLKSLRDMEQAHWEQAHWGEETGYLGEAAPEQTGHEKTQAAYNAIFDELEGSSTYYKSALFALYEIE